MRILEFEVALGFRAHLRVSLLVDVGSGRVHLTLEGFNCHGLVALGHLLLLEH